ncbi:MAG: GAF domain-containing protein [Bacteroidota bacterium]
MTLTIQPILDSLSNKSPIEWSPLLSDILAAFDCSTGTIHTLETDNMLHLKAYQGIPEFLLPKMTIIPLGKGMAGIAAERKQPVQLCNLQTDESGVARPSARDTKVEGSLAAPMLLNSELYGTLGIAKPVPYDFTLEETNALMQIGQAISKNIGAQAE